MLAISVIVTIILIGIIVQISASPVPNIVLAVSTIRHVFYVSQPQEILVIFVNAIIIIIMIIIKLIDNYALKTVHLVFPHKVVQIVFLLIEIFQIYVNAIKNIFKAK